MYNDKEVTAILRAYTERGDGMDPEVFVRSIEKEEGWDYDDKQPAMFMGNEELGTEDGYLVKIGLMLPVPAKNIGLGASNKEVVEEFKNLYPWLSAVIGDEDDKVFILKEGDMSNKAYTGGGEVKEKVPKHKSYKLNSDKNEVSRYEVLVKKIRYDDGTWNTVTHEISNGDIRKEFNTEECLDTLVSAAGSVIRSSGDKQGEYMEKSMNHLNELFLDADANVVDITDTDLESPEDI